MPRTLVFISRANAKPSTRPNGTEKSVKTVVTFSDCQKSLSSRQMENVLQTDKLGVV